MQPAELIRLGGILALLTTFAPPVRAAEPSVPATRAVGVLPVKHYARPEATLFSPDVQPPSEVTEAIERFLVERLSAELNLSVVGPDALGRHVAAVRRTPTHTALQRMKLGRDLYQQLQVREAIESLEDAYSNLSRELHGLVSAETMSELALLLALSHAERQAPEVHTWLKEMYRHTPWRTFKRGFYSTDFEGQLESALHDFNATYPKEAPFGDPERREQFMNVAEVDVIVQAWLEAEGSQEVLRIRLFDRHSRDFPGSIPFNGMDDATTRERLDRFLTRWATCLPTRDVAVPPPEVPQNRFFIDTGFAYSIYMKDTTRQPFHNLGMGLAGEYQFLSGLGGFVQLNMFTSTLDPQRDLLDSFTSVRTIFGVSYAFRGVWWRLYARGGFDIQLLGNYSTSTNPWCKWAGRGDPQCADDVTDLEDEVTAGFYGALGVQFFMNRNVYATLRVSATSYIIPLDQSIKLNFPFTGELALGYSF